MGNRTQLIKDDGSGDVTYDYSYNGLGQLTKVEWTVGGKSRTKPIHAEWEYNSREM